MRLSRLRFLLLWIPAGLVYGAPIALASAAAPSDTAVRLQPGQELVLDVRADGLPIAVGIDLGEHTFAMVEVEQRGVDVEVVDPGGPCMAEAWAVDLRRSTTGTEHLPVASDPDRPGSGLEIRPARPEVPAKGRVSLRLRELRAAQGSVAECRAWRAFLDARVAALDRSPEAQRRAVAHYQRGVELFRSVGDDAGLGQTLLNLAATENRLGHRGVALHHLSEARRRLSGIDSARPSLYEAVSETAIIFERLGRYELAGAFFSDALELARELEDPYRVSKALNGLGLVHKRLDQWSKALDYYSRALELARGNRCREAAVRVNLGTAYLKLGEFQSALEQSTEAVQLASGSSSGTDENERPCRLASAALNSLGLVYTRLERWRIAAASFEQALALSDTAGRRAILINLGRALQKTGESQRARDVFLEAAELSAEHNDPVAQFSAWANLGYLTLHEFHDPESARRHYDAAQRFARGETSHESNGLLVLRAELNLVEGRPEIAAEQASAALERAEAQEHQVQQAAALHVLTKCRLAEGRFAEAVAVARRAAGLVEQLRLHSADPDLRASFLAGRFRFFELWIQALVELHRADGDRRWLEESLEVAERSRARALLDMLDMASIEDTDRVDPRLMDLERELESLYLRRRSLTLRDQEGDNAASDDERAHVERALSSVQARILERRADLQASHARWSQLHSPETLEAAAMRREVIDEETALLYFFVGEDAGWRWLVTKGGLSAAEIPAREDLDARVRTLLKAVTEPARPRSGEDLDARRARLARSRQEADELSRSLARDLLGTDIDRLHAEGVRRVVVVPDGALAYLPFGALRAPGTGDPIILDFEWAQLPSVSVLASIRRSAPTDNESPPSLAVLADPVFSSADPRIGSRSEVTTRRAATERTFSRLPGTAAEADAVAALVTGEALVATGFEATAELAKSGELGRYRVVHFATHGIIETEYPELSALVLSQFDSSGRPVDGFLRLPDIYRLRLNADLVVLSACETALGQELRGEGLIGLTRGFLYAGASSVVASLWTVEDRATQRLMSLMYRHHLEAGLPASSALHLAQREMALDPRYGPYHWAGFVLQGDWR